MYSADPDGSIALNMFVSCMGHGRVGVSYGVYVSANVDPDGNLVLTWTTICNTTF